MDNRILSFLAAFLIHLGLLAALFFSIVKKPEIPKPAMVIDITTLGEKSHERKIAKTHNLKKEEREVAQHYHKLAGQDSSDAPKKTALVFNPLPQIPDDLRDEAFASDAIVRFYIEESGNVARVELIKPCANPRLNMLLLKSLKNWKFSPAEKNSTQDIRVNFKVE